MTDPLALFFRPHEVEVAPGVWAVVRRERDDLVVMWLRAERPGSGAVSRWLDGLPNLTTVRMIAVSDERLVAMLERRGFKRILVLSPAGDFLVSAHVRYAAGDRTGI